MTELLVCEKGNGRSCISQSAEPWEYEKYESCERDIFIIFFGFFFVY